jgi:hypothetical protein
MRELWAEFFGSALPEGEEVAKVNCPFHRDQEKSFSINMETDACRCERCGFEGNFKTFQTLLLGHKTLKEFFDDGGVASSPPKFIDLQRVRLYHLNLLDSQKRLDFLIKERLLDLETIRRFQLGLDRGRIIIPVWDLEGRCVNLRKYDPFDKKGFKMISERGHGQTRIFPIRNLRTDKPVLFLEGEMDTILANHLGYNAVTLTTGVSSRIPEDDLRLFKGKEVAICFDVQEVSNRAAKRTAKVLRSIARRVKIIFLPEELEEKGDFTDFFHKFEKKQFDELLMEEIYEIRLEQLVHAEFYNKRVRVVAKVSGKDEVPFLVPELITLRCERPKMTKECVSCPLLTEKEILVAENDPVLLEMILVPSASLKGVLNRLVNIPRGCKRLVEVEIKRGRNVQGLRLVPEKLMVGSGRWVVRNAFAIGHEVEANAIYEFEGTVLPEPRQQYSSFLIDTVRAEENPLDAMESASMENLGIFQPAVQSVVGIRKKIAELNYFLQQNVTKMYGRGDLIQVVNSVFFTPIAFYFQGDIVQRGWGDVLILGDPRQGKSKTVERLFDFYGLGEIVSGEKATVAGLKGGCSQVGKTWNLQWGIIPLNDRGIVCVDEVQNMESEVFSSLSRMRSEGVAEIVMIRTEKTLSRTRLIWVGNPKTNRALRTWPYGIEAAQSFGRLADVARFDLVLMVGDGEVSLEEIRQGQKEGEIEDKYPQKFWRQLILWAWSRKPSQIKFEDGVEDYIFEVAKEIADRYRCPIPVVKDAEERFIVAKYAVSLAAQLFSTNPSHSEIRVNEYHVSFVRDFFDEVFSKGSCQLDEYAKMQQSQDSLEDTESLRKFISEQGGRNLIESLFAREYISFSDFQDLFGIDRSMTKNTVSILVQNRAIRRSKSGPYVKTPAFISLLKSMRDGITF